MWLELTRASAKCRLLLPIMFPKRSTHLFGAGKSVESDTMLVFGVKYVTLANFLAVTSFHLILLAHFVYVYDFVSFGLAELSPSKFLHFALVCNFLKFPCF